MLRPLITSGVLAVFILSCVPARKVEELTAKKDKCELELKGAKINLEKLETANKEMQQQVNQLNKQVDALVADSTLFGHSIRKMQKQYDKINKLNDELLRKQGQLQKGNRAETTRLMNELQELQENLQRKEDDLKVMDREINTKKADIEKMGVDLALRERRVKELEGIISQKDSAVNGLKRRVSDALLGFQDKGLSIEQKNGKIYVSLEAKLLFSKGGTAIDEEGKDALINLAKVLENQTDISVLVEGHTDTDKLSGKTIKDNWELSTMRATAVVRVMTENSQLNPSQLTAAGRGEHHPLDSEPTEEAKAKNRRIEVILTPNLDDLFEIISPN